MNERMLSIAIFFLFLACHEQAPANSGPILLTDTIPTPTISLEAELLSHGIQQFPDTSLSYTQMKQQVKQIREQLISAGPNISTDSVFTELLVNQIFPFWYGTPWSFEGHMAKPRAGEVACGYFVSTTLLHLGLNLNRYRLAQQLPIHEAKSLAIDTNMLLTLELENTAKHIADLHSRTEEGIYFIGFDASHVGFLLNRANKIYLIHSNYLDAKGVMIERIEESEVFAAYGRFYLVPLSKNPGLLKRWLEREEIIVYTE